MRLLLAAILLTPFTAAAQYTTQFANSQNPLNEGGAWQCAQSPWFPVASTPGFAYGTQNGASNYTDSTCVLTGSWNSNQSASITVKVNGANTAQFEEVETHVNMTIGNGSITGYEGNCSVAKGQNYMQIVRWNGPSGKFQELDGRTTSCITGDVLTLSRSGATLTLTQTRASKAIASFSVTDSTYLNGSPGIGFYIQTVQSGTAAQANAEFGASSFTATGGSTGGNTPPPQTYSVTLNWQNPGGNDAVVSYNVYRAANGSSTFAKIAGTTALTFTDNSVADGSVYSYYATSVDGSGIESPPSNTLNFTIPTSTASGPLPPANFTGVLN
jgi:hypothetical protein